MRTLQMASFDLTTGQTYHYEILPTIADKIIEMREALATALYSGAAARLSAGVVVRPIRSWHPDPRLAKADKVGRDGKIEIRLLRGTLKPDTRGWEIVQIACYLSGIPTARIVPRGARIHIYHDRPIVPVWGDGVRVIRGLV